MKLNELKKNLNKPISCCFVFSVFFFLIFLIMFLIGTICFKQFYNFGVRKDNSVFMSDFFDICAIAASKDMSKNSNPGLTILLGSFFELIKSPKTMFTTVVSFFFFFGIPIFVCSYLAINFLKKNDFSKIEITQIFCILLFSFPFIFCFERANFIIYAFMFCCLFLTFYNSESRIKRELSYLFLALSGGIKFYPLIFGVIILRKKDWIGVLKVFIYFCLAIVLPFFFLPGGISGFVVTYKNILIYSNSTLHSLLTDRSTFDSSIAAILSYIVFIFTRKNFIDIYKMNGFSFTVNVISIVVLILLILLALFSIKKFFVYLICAVTIMIVPHPSFLYTSIFLYIPFIYLLTESKELFTKDKKLFLPSFIIIFCPLYFGTLIKQGDYSLIHDAPVKILFVFLTILYFIILLFYFVYKDFDLWRHNKNEYKKFLQ